MRELEVKAPPEEGGIEVMLSAHIIEDHFDTDHDDSGDFFSVHSSDDDDEEEDYAWDEEETRPREHCQPDTSTMQQQQQLSKMVRFRRSLRTYWRNQRVACVWLILYALANVMAFYCKAKIYATNPKHEAAREVFGNCVVVARGAAQCLNLNIFLILLPLCRHFWTFLQTSPALRCCACFPDQYYDYYNRKKPKRLHWSSWLPLDQWVFIHRVIGMAILYWTLLHCAAHACDFHRFANHPFEEDLLLLFPDMDSMPSDPASRWKLLLQQPAAITGLVMVFCILLAYPCILYHKKFGYNVFWYSHHLLLVMIVTLLFHGMGRLLEPPKSYLWVGIPLALYMIPRLSREVASLFCHKVRVNVLELSIKSGKVVCLKMTKPAAWRNNRLQAGMYANLNIPHLSMVQWHPFTLSSAPSDDFVEFHIRPVGDWTTELYLLAKAFARQQESNSISKAFDEEEATHTQSTNSLPRIPVVKLTPLSVTTTVPTPTIRQTSSIQRGEPERVQPSSRGMNRLRSQQWLWDAGSSLFNLHGADSNASGDTMEASISTLGPIPEQGQVNLTLQDLIIKVDGPLGAPAQDYSRLRMVVLVGAGIGITPMISVLKELLANPGKMQRIYLIWTFREQRAMEWFSSLIQDVLEKNEQGKHALQLRFFVTSDHNKAEIKQTESATLISNSPSLAIQYGQRPNWFNELTRIQQDIRAQQYHKCGVFVCGPSAMGKMICRTTCRISQQDPDFHFYCRQETFSV